MCCVFVSQDGYFKGFLFSRVVKHSVIQAGQSAEFDAVKDWALQKNHLHTRFATYCTLLNMEKIALTFWFLADYGNSEILVLMQFKKRRIHGGNS